MARHRKPVADEPVENIGTQTLSVRLPTLEMRRELTVRCERDGIAVAKFVADVVEAYLEGRLRIIKKPVQEPSYLIAADPEG